MKKPISIFMMLLIVLIPLCVSIAIADSDGTSSGTNESNVPSEDAAQACMDKYTEGQEFVDFMDNGIIDVLTKISMTLHGICSTMSALNQVISTVGMVFGYLGDAANPQCDPFPGNANVPMCTFNAAVWNPWYGFYKGLSHRFCIPFEGGFVLAVLQKKGWSSGLLGGDSSETTTGASSGATATEGILSQANNLFDLQDANVFERGWINIGALGLSAYDNIYTASLCVSIPAILFNLRKLKQVYMTYNCCVEDSCRSGNDVDNCERQLDISTCMYWEGSLYQSLYSILAHVITQAFMKLIGRDIGEWLAKGVVTKWFAVIYELYQLPTVFQNLESSFQMIIESFDEPSCGDLDFDDYTESDVAEREQERRYELTDTNNDGIYDVSSEGGSQ